MEKIFLALMASLPFFAQAAGPGATNAIPPLRPPHAEIPLTFGEQYGWLVIVAVLILIGLAGTVTWLLTRPGPPVIIPPEEQARLALTALPATATDGATLSRVSQILRHYVRRAFELPPGELTTTEFCRVLSTDPQIGVGLSLALIKFFQDNDLRKFSPANAAPSTVSPVAQALALVDRCETRRAELRGTPAVTAAPDRKF